MSQAILSAPISSAGLLSLTPLLIISSVIIVQLLQISFRRHADLCFVLTQTGFILSFFSLLAVYNLLPQNVTPLLLVDHYALFFMGLILASAILLLPLSHDYWRRRRVQCDEYYLLFTLSILGALVVVCSRHFASFVLGLELLSLPLIAMIGYPFTNRYAPSLEAAIKYLLLSGVALAFLLFGAALIYADQGSLNFTALGRSLIFTPLQASPLLLTGTMLVLAGMAFKLSLAPFHLWTPDVYQGAPVPVTALLSTVVKTALAALLLRWFLASQGFNIPQLVWSLTLIAITSMLVGNLLALLQQDIKRLMACSTIAHFGYLLVALLALSRSLTPNLAVEAVSFYLVAYTLSTLAVFAVVMQLSVKEPRPGDDGPEERDQLPHYRGLYWRQPLLALVMTLALLSLAGIPLTVGFIGKFYLFAAAVEEELWLVLLAVVIGSGIGLFYYLRIILIMADATPVQDPASASTPPHTRWHGGGNLVLIILGLLTLWMGIQPSPLIALIQSLTAAIG